MMMVNRILVKVRVRSGETISETLVALLISSLALVMLASMINSTVNIVSTSKKKMNEYYEACTELERFAEEAEISGSDEQPAADEQSGSGLTVTQGSTTITISSSSTSDISVTENVNYRMTSAFGTTVAAYNCSPENTSEETSEDNSEPSLVTP